MLGAIVSTRRLDFEDISNALLKTQRTLSKYEDRKSVSDFVLAFNASVEDTFTQQAVKITLVGAGGVVLVASIFSID